MKKGFILAPFLIAVVFVSLGYFGYEKYKENTKNVGAPLSARYERELTPVEDSKYYLGTSSPSLKAWRGLIVDEICLDSDCKTAWPTGGGGSGGGTWSTTTSGVAGRLFNYPNNNTDIVLIGSNSSTTAEVFFDPNIQSYRIGSSLTASTTILGNATTTGSLGAGAILVNGDYITDFTGTNLSVTNGVLNASGGSGNVSTSTNETSGRLAYWTSTNGTPALLADVATTTLTASAPLSLSQPVVKVGGSNSVLTIDTSGTWSGNAGTASALAANGANCSSGNAPLGVDASGAVESCFDVWTEAENTSAGYSRFPFTVNTGYNSTTTILGFLNGFFSTASSTVSGDFRLPALSQGFSYIGSTGKVNSIASSSINLSWFNNDAGFNTYAWPFTPQTWGVSTSTTLGMLNGFLSTASSTVVGNATTTGGQYVARLYGANLSACNATTQKLLWTADGQFTCGTDAGAGGGMTSFTAGDGLLGGTITDGQTVYGQVGTSSLPSLGQIPYWTALGTASSPARLGNIATGTISVPTGLTGTANRYVLGGNFTLGLDTGYVIPLQANLLSTTTALTTGHIPFVSGFNTFSSRATTTASCSGSVSCSSFDILGSSPVTITGSGLTSYDAWSHTLFGGQAGGNFYSATTSMMAFGTSTATNNLATLTVSSSTASQLALSAGAGIAQWTLRNAGANLYFSTTTVAGTSTSTPFLSILNTGNFLIGTTTSWLNSAFNLVGTTTISGNFSNLRASTTANTTQTINWSAKQANGVASTYWDIMLTGNTNIVMNSTSSNPVDGAFYKIRVCQDGTGSRTLTWANPISLRWGGKGTTTISSTANTCSFILFNYTATNGTGIYTGIASTTGAPIR